jgi:O-antigen/teichoic acid export membrane protein
VSSDPVATGSAFGRLRGRIVGDAVLYAGARAVANGASFAMVVLLSRTLVPSELGLYSVLLGAVGLSSLLWFSWFSSAAFRYSAEYRVAGTLWRMRATAVRIYTLLGIGLAVLVAAIWAVGVPWIGELPGVVAGVWILLLVVSSPAGSIPDLYRAEGRSVPSAATTLVLSLAPIVAILLFAAMSTVDLVVVIGAQAAVAGAVFLSAGLSWGSRPAFPPHETRDMLQRFFRFGWPLVASGVCAWVLSLADRYIIALIETASEVGYYTVGYQIGSAPLLFLYGAISLPFEPLAYSAYAAGAKDRAFDLVGKTVGLTLAAETIGLILLVGAKDEIISTFIDPLYRRAVDVVPLVALGVAVYCVALVRQQAYVVAEHTRSIFTSLLIASVLNVVLNFALVPALSIEGAALATTLAYVAYAAFIFIRAHRRFPAPIPRGWLVQIAVGGVAAAGAYAALDAVLDDGWGPVVARSVVAIGLFAGALSFGGDRSIVAFMRSVVRTSGAKA